MLELINSNTANSSSKKFFLSKRKNATKTKVCILHMQYLLEPTLFIVEVAEREYILHWGQK